MTDEKQPGVEMQDTPAGNGKRVLEPSLSSLMLRPPDKGYHLQHRLRQQRPKSRQGIADILLRRRVSDCNTAARSFP